METRLHKRVKRYLRYLLMRGVVFLIGLLPLGFARRMGRALGGLGFHLAPSQRRKALASLAIAFPDKTEAEHRALARESLAHLGECAAEFCCYQQVDRQLSTFVTLPPEGKVLMEQVHAEGKGCVFISAHVGNFELVPKRLALLGVPAASIAKPPSDPHTQAFIDRIRSQVGARIIWRASGNTYQVVEQELRAGHFIGFLIDQDTRGRGVFVDFFGRPAFTTRGAADLAFKTGAAVMTGFIFRRPDGGHRLELGRIVPARTGDLEADVVALTQQMTGAIEQAVRQAPAHWAWIHQRWKTRPPEIGALPQDQSKLGT